MNLKLRYLLPLLISITVFAGTPDNATRVLVLSDNIGIYVSHSIFFNEIKAQGFDLEFRNLQSPQMNLIQFGEWQYDQMIIFASNVEDFRGLKVREIMDFFDAGKNIMILGSPDMSKPFRHMVNGFGIDMHGLGSQVYDHFSTSNENDATYVLTSNVFGDPIAPNVQKPILYRGAGLSLTPYETNQVWGVVRGSETAYSKRKDGDNSDLVASSNVIYVGAMQGRNNARVIFTGGQEIFSDEVLVQREYGNTELLSDLVRWNFGQSGILKQGELVHRRISSTDVKPVNYRISEDVYFSCEIFRWDFVNDRWVPYVSPSNDLLLEFVMLDPYYRIPLKKGPDAKYEIEFKIPDKYGIFQFKINYFRPGFSFLKIAEKITVRPYRHDEYPRYLTQAFPYYLSSFATMGGFLVFVIAFLLSRSE